MVFTLHRYIFRELLRIFILATVALTLVLSLGGVLRPVQEYGVGPRQVVHLLFYFMPITLTFVLPMAALFASALAYGRLASDNEFDACRASGISVLTLVYPGFVLAILVATANLILSFHVMPYFVHLAEKSLKADAKQILFRNIQRRGFYGLPPDGRYYIYADHVDPKNDTLFGIVVVQYGGDSIKRIITADIAKVQFDPHDKFYEVHLSTHNCKLMGAAANDYWTSIRNGSFKYEFGSLLGDDIKFKKINEMKQIQGDPMRFDPVARTVRAAHTQLATELLAQDIAMAMSASKGNLYELQGESRSIRISATTSIVEKPAAISLVQPIIVDEYDSRSGERVRRLQCEKAEIYVEEGDADPRLGIDLHSARDEETGSLLVQYVIGDLTLPQKVRQSLEGESALRAVLPDHTRSVLGGPPSWMLAEQQNLLVRTINNALIDIRAETNSRLVFGVGCIPMILIGIGLGIILRGGHLLSAFGASCLPAVVLVVAIICGKRITENVGSQGPSGVLIMWAGLAFLVLLSAWVYRRLLRQ